MPKRLLPSFASYRVFSVTRGAELSRRFEHKSFIFRTISVIEMRVQSVKNGKSKGK